MTPEEVAALLKQNSELDEKCASLNNKVGKLNNKVGKLINKVGELEELLTWFKKQLFGAKSERRILEELSPADQLWLGEEMLELPEKPPAEDVTVAELERKRRPRTKRQDEDRSQESIGSRLVFSDDVPIEEVIIKDPELLALPEDKVEIIGQDVSYKLAQRSPYFVLKTVRTTWRKKDEKIIRKVPIPSVVDRSIADASFLAGLAVDKIYHHLPLYRQHQRLKHAGFTVARSTLTRLLNRVAEMCEIFYQAQLSSILQSDVITMDESPTPAGRKGGKMKRGYYWALYGDKGEVSFVYSPTRSRSVIDRLLEGYQGVLHSDGYQAYNSFCKKTQGVIWAGCWAHTRRKFIEAEHLEPDKVKKILEKLQALYKIEDEAGIKPKLLKKLRASQSQTIVDELFSYFKKELDESTLLPSNKFIEALEYALKHEAPLRVFLENPEVAIDTNHIERQIRYPVMGRKNWMFHWTEDGARHSGILYSLLLTCTLQNIDPRTYLIDVLQRMDSHPGRDAYQLTPLNWSEAVAGNPMRSLAGC